MESIKWNYSRGFTLIELLVVVLIIGILAAVAVPQYKHAALKARFATVKPMAKAIADAQEVYYQGRQMYALYPDELDVTPVEAENVSVSLSQTDGYDYVMAQHSKVPGARYVIYQKYSPNYPGEIHCEAQVDNADAQWVCNTMSGNNNDIGQVLENGYLAYIVNGTGAGLPVGAGDDSEGGVSCEAANTLGLSCNITTNEAGEQVKQICADLTGDNYCSTKTYNEEGGYTSVTCKADSNGVCTGNGKLATYDANGNQLTQRTCSSVDSSGNCTAYESYGNEDYTYGANGKVVTKRTCDTIDSSGNCTSYKSGVFYTYDDNGEQMVVKSCSGSNFNTTTGDCIAYNTSIYAN